MTTLQRRTDKEKVQVGNYYSGAKRYYDQMSEVTVVKIFSGDCYATSTPGEVCMTILGSCISACIRDPMVKVGGMNHFLLPEAGSSSEDGARYGAFAMEKLINEIIKLGGIKSRLEVKLFGGGNVIESSAMIGSKNVKFAKEYVRREGLKIVSEDLGGDYPRRIHYYPDTGKVMMRKLHRKEDLRIVEEERKFAKQISHKPVEGDVELF